MAHEIKELTQNEMDFLKMKDREFAQYLMEDMSKEGDAALSHATVINWRKHGRPPLTDFLQDMLSVYPETDRRFAFALKMLAIKSPHIWGFGGVVWTLRQRAAKLIE